MGTGIHKKQKNWQNKFYNVLPRRLFRWMGYIVKPNRCNLSPSYMLYGLIPLFLFITSIISLINVDNIEWFVLVYHIAGLFYKYLLSFVNYKAYTNQQELLIADTYGICLKTPNPFYYELVFQPASNLIALLIVLIVTHGSSCPFSWVLCFASIIANFMGELFSGLKAFFAVSASEFDLEGVIL